MNDPTVPRYDLVKLLDVLALVGAGREDGIETANLIKEALELDVGEVKAKAILRQSEKFMKLLGEPDDNQEPKPEPVAPMIATMSLKARQALQRKPPSAVEHQAAVKQLMS